MPLIKISDITLLPELTVREKYDADLAAQYAECLDQLPPITVYDIDGKLCLVDGRHRMEARKQRGQEMIEANVLQGTLAEALEDAITSNIKHGKPLTIDERKTSCRKLIKAYPDRSHRWIGRSCAINDKTVANIRKGLERTQEIPIIDKLIDDTGAARQKKNSLRVPLSDLSVKIHFASPEQKAEFLKALDMARIMTGSESMAFQVSCLAQEFIATYMQHETTKEGGIDEIF